MSSALAISKGENKPQAPVAYMGVPNATSDDSDGKPTYEVELPLADIAKSTLTSDATLTETESANKDGGFEPCRDDWSVSPDWGSTRSPSISEERTGYESDRAQCGSCTDEDEDEWGWEEHGSESHKVDEKQATSQPDTFKNASATDELAHGEISLADLRDPENFSNEFFEVKASPLGGNGAFARRDLKEGEMILVEKPTLQASFWTLYEELDKLAPGVRASFDRMHAHKRNPEMDRRHAIMLTNSFMVGSGTCLYLIAARFNHSCRQMASVDYTITPDRVMKFRMRRDVPAGAELTISYGPLTPKNLYVMWGFRCACGGCSPLTDEEVAEIDNAYSQW
ncbi:hypothetical protein AAE478_009414 [Parahypoxylon ruwenzoriense]